MNSKSTVALILLATVAAVWLWKGDDWGPKLGVKPRHVEPPPSAAAAILDSLTPAKVMRVEITFDGDEPLDLTRTEKGWKLPGNWPPRQQAVEELVAVLGNLPLAMMPFPSARAPISRATDWRPTRNLSSSSYPLMSNPSH